MKRFTEFIEWKVFGVCESLAEKFGIATTTVRKYFIYLSFFTFGSPVIIYFFMAFWMNIRKHLTNYRRNPVKYT